jgi:hypothetical protein
MLTTLTSFSFIVPLVFIELLVMIVALIDCIRARQTNGPKWLWIVIIVLIQIIGPVLYFVIGRNNR